MTDYSLRLDFRAPDFGTPVDVLYEEGLKMAEWADQRGFREVTLSEHHCSPDNYLPSPLVMGAAIAARTEHIKIRMSAMALPLHDPIRLAEDIAVLDQISKGRVELVFAGGYVPAEFALFNRRLEDRGRLMEDYLDILYKAWSGQTFEYNGQAIKVTPPSYQQPRPKVSLGGSSKAAARRAARLADECVPTSMELYMLYMEECKKLGKKPYKMHVPGPIYLHVSEDPESIWPIIAPHAMHETNAYAAWQEEAGTSGPYRTMKSLEDIKSFGHYKVITPQETIARAQKLGDAGLMILHPLMGGLDPEVGWANLELFASKVMPALNR